MSPGPDHRCWCWIYERAVPTRGLVCIRQLTIRTADLRGGRADLTVTVADWRADAEWFHARQIGVVRRLRSLQWS